MGEGVRGDYMLDKLEYKCKMESLFSEWKQKKSIEIKGHEVQRVSFNEDGIVNPDIWFNVPEGKRILFVLKETHDDNKTNWSLVEYLNKDESRHKIWRRAAEWTRGILSTNNEQPVETYERLEREAAKQVIQNIAVLNLKKSPGGSSANWDEIAAYAKADIELIEKEIDIINPSIILFGGTFWYFQKAYSKAAFSMNKDMRYCYGVLAGKERLLIDYWHPANHYPAITSYYGITGIYQAALREKR